MEDLSTILAGIICSAKKCSNVDWVLDSNSSRALCRSQFLGEAGDDEGSGTGDDGDSGCDDGDGGDSN